MKSTGKVSEVICKYEWEIENFLSYNDDSPLYSPEFHAFGSSWYIRINPKGKPEHKGKYISLYLHVYEKETPIICEFMLGIKRLSNTNNYGLYTFYTFKSDGFGLAKFIERSELLERASELVPSGKLTIICSLNLKTATTDFDLSREKLVEDLKILFTSEESSDAALYVKEVKYLVHRSVLIARSPVFAAMFINDTEEKQTGIVKITDCDPEAFNIFLLYLYTAEVDFAECNVCELYRISDKYDVPELKTMCVDFMSENLSIENFNEILILSDQFDETGLLARIQNFFNKNFAKIVSSTSWEHLVKNNYRLSNALLIAMAPKVDIRNNDF